MRIATYNIHHWHTQDFAPNFELIVDTLAETDADIIGLNEVVYGRTVEGYAQPALESLAERLDMQYVFGATARWPAEDDMPEEAFGNALLSRWPIAASANHMLNPVPDKGQRAMLEARIQLPNGRPLTVYVTHLDHTDEAARVIQLRSVREWISRDRNRPHFVMGDFNSVSPWDMDAKPDIQSALQAHELGCNMVPDSGPQVVARMERAGYVDLFTRFGEPGSRSYVPSQIPIRIDYIFANQLMAERVETGEIWHSSGPEGSDHLPVVVDFEM